MAHLTKLAEALPEAGTEITGRRGEHRKFFVGKKTFGYYLHHHHNDGVIGLCAKVPPGEIRLAGDDPKRFYIPAYLGPSGWVGLRLDLAKVNWAEVEHLLAGSYLLQAPKRLAAKVVARA